MNLFIREDLLSAKSISPLGKIILSYFAAMYYYKGEMFNMRLDYLAGKFGVTWGKIDDELELLCEKGLISVTYINSKDVEILLEKTLNMRFPELLKRKPDIEPTTGRT